MQCGEKRGKETKKRRRSRGGKRRGKRERRGLIQQIAAMEREGVKMGEGPMGKSSGESEEADDQGSFFERRGGGERGGVRDCVCAVAIRRSWGWARRARRAKMTGPGEEGERGEGDKMGGNGGSSASRREEGTTGRGVRDCHVLSFLIVR